MSSNRTRRTGYILRTDAPDWFIQAIRAVAAGEEGFSRQLLHRAVQTQILATPENAPEQLTKGELDDSAAHL